MKYIKMLLVIFAPIFIQASPPGDAINTNSTLKNATVFRNGAELIHTANATLLQGNNELIIEGLSNAIDINSLRVQCPATVTILGIEFNNNYITEELVSPSAKRWQDSMYVLNDAIKKTDILLSTQNEVLDLLQRNKEVKGEQSGLSVAELTKLVNYYEAKSAEVREKINALNERKTKLAQIYAKVAAQFQEEQKKNTKKGGRLILQLNAALAGTSEFSITYLTQNAYWIPYYDIKADNISSPLKFIYKAKIAQTTGLDWKKVKLSLSTSTPTQFGNAPVLRTWFLSYIDPFRLMQKQMQVSNTIPSLSAKTAGTSLEEVVVTGYGVNLRGSATISNDAEPVYIVNGAIMSKSEYSKIRPQAIAKVEVLKDDAATSMYGAQAANGAIVVTLKDELKDYVSVSSNELDITYDIEIPYDVPTNGKMQIATLHEITVPATYKYYAVPKLDKEAFLLAEVANWQTLNLLPGEANVIFENTYIGKTFIDPANTNDTLNLTLGTDKRVIVKREKAVDFSSTKLIGTNKVQTITYDIIVKNNKREAITLILKDQFPISSNKDIEATRLEHSNASINDETGAVTWIHTIAAGQSVKSRISYSAKYPKTKTINLN